MEELTPAQARVYRFIAKEIHGNGAPPTYRAIAHHFGFRSNRAAQDHVAALVRKGWIEHIPGISRGLRLKGQAGGRGEQPLMAPIMGQVAAGSPRAGFQLPMGAVPFPRDLVKGEPELFALRVAGDSMMDAGILDGDVVIARTSRTAVHGDIVVALLDGDSTVKRLHKKDGKIFLVPENARMKPIPVGTADLVIQGRVIGLQRFYR